MSTCVDWEMTQQGGRDFLNEYMTASVGGDIKAIRQAALDQPYVGTNPSSKTHPIAKVFQSEYALVVHLSELHMPTIGICEGVWMGFGMVRLHMHVQAPIV